MEELIIKPFEFTSRLNKYVLIPYYLDYLSSHSNLKDGLLDIQMKAFDQTLDFSSDIWAKNSNIEERIKGAKEIKERISLQYQTEIDNYFPILFNQALIISCTVFDLFLIESLKAITEKQKNVLKMLANKEDITISEVIDNNDYENIFSTIQTKVLKRFEFSSAEEKFKIFKKLGIDLSIVFELKLSKQEVKDKYPGGLNYLKEIYQIRNEIAHKNLLPVKTYEELSDIAFFLQSLILGLSYAIGDHFKIRTDIILMYQNDIKK